MYKHGEFLFKSSFETWLAYPIIFVSTVFLTYSGMFTASAYTLPLFAPFGVFAPLLLAVKLGGFERGIKHLIFWAVIFSGAIFFLTLYDEPTVKLTVIQSSPFSNEKFSWIKYGTGISFKNYFNSTIIQLFIVCVSSLVSGGIIGLLIVSRDLAKMGYYIGLLNYYSDDSFVSSTIAWEIWTVIKLIGFLFCIMSLSSYFLYWIMDFELEKRKIMKYFIIGILMVFSSIVFWSIFEKPTQNILNKCAANNVPVSKLPPDDETTDFKF